ncbi:MAG: hypothetical protein IKN20_09625, partial [Firmicutes bacterium]|nr:hypothetical protein [Bacillota bacterium]
MTEIVKNSLVIRFIVCVYEGLRRFWRSSLLGRGWKGWHESWLHSNTKVHWENWCGMDDPAVHSVYAKFLRTLEKLLQKVGEWLRCSLFYRIVIAVRDWYFRISEGSRILSVVNRVPLRRWLFLAFALYLPIEYALRDVLQ